jgi:nucleotide-binding universal stress UspA family protein
MQQILVGVDGSRESRAALRTALDLARARKSLVRMVCVVPPFEAFAVDFITIPQQRDAAQKAARGLVDALAAEVNGFGVPVETQVAHGIPAETLADLAQEPEVEMVVVGHRGRGAMARLMIGSVADRLVQIATKPVLIVR